MNLPNKLTLLRMALVPVFVALLMAPGPAFQLAAALVFALASATDWFDGWYARRHHMVTDFGKLMDPMADKLLVMAALVGLLAQGRAPWLAVMVLLGREFIISGIRLVAAAKGEVIAAGLSGKLKTVSQMLGLILLLAGGWTPWMAGLGKCCCGSPWACPYGPAPNTSSKIKGCSKHDLRILSVGTELLLGQIANTDAQYLPAASASTASPVPANHRGG